MAENSHISWTDETHNHWKGCTKVSVGPKGACENCYAENWAKRWGQVEWNAPPVLTSEANRRKPLKWEREAAADAKLPQHQRRWPNGRFVFCCSLADVFDKNAPAAWRRELFDLIRATPHLTWLLLTKRPQNIVKLFCEATGVDRRGHSTRPSPDEEGVYIPGLLLADHWPRNAAIGCTVVTQKEADRDIPALLAAKAALDPAFAFLSMEPLMEAVDLRRLRIPSPLGRKDDGWGLDALTGRMAPMLHLGPGEFELDGGGRYGPRIDWVITGKESDQTVAARITPDGACEGVRDQCLKAGVPYHHKQNGEWTKITDPAAATGRLKVVEVDGVRYAKVGLKNTGRELGGVIYDARPVPKHAVAA